MCDKRNCVMFFDLQKASVLKRISAALLDFILISILATGVAFIISAAVDFDGYSERLEEYYAEYEKDFGVKFDISSDEYEGLPDAEKAKYDEAYKALIENQDAMHTYSMVVNLTLVIASAAIFVSYMVLEFAVPLILKNGQTVGKKIFGIGLMRTDSVKVSPIILFIRALLGKYTIETMIPVLIIVMIYFNSIGIVGVIVLGLIVILEIVMMISTRTNSMIHDLLANTVAVDMSSQMIFDSVDDMIEYKKKLHAESVANQKN